MRVITYKSIKIVKLDDGKIVISGLKGKDILKDVIPDAVNYVKNDYGKRAELHLNGLTFFVDVDTSLKELTEQWKYEHFRFSGIEI